MPIIPPTPQEQLKTHVARYLKKRRTLSRYLSLTRYRLFRANTVFYEALCSTPEAARAGAEQYVDTLVQIERSLPVRFSLTDFKARSRSEQMLQLQQMNEVRFNPSVRHSRT